MAKHLLPCCFINHSCFLILENVSGIVKFTSVSVLIKHEGSGVVTCCCGGQGGGGGGNHPSSWCSKTQERKTLFMSKELNWCLNAWLKN